MKKIIGMLIILIGVIGIKVNALNITTTQDIGNIEDIIEIYMNKEDITNKRYIILNDGKLRMITCDKNQYEQNGSEIIINKGTIITKDNGTTTVQQDVNDITIHVQHMIYSDIKINNAKVNGDVESIKNTKWKLLILIYGLGIGLGLLLVKGMIE